MILLYHQQPALPVLQVISSLTPQMVGYTVMVFGFSCMILVRLCCWLLAA